LLTSAMPKTGSVVVYPRVPTEAEAAIREPRLPSPGLRQMPAPRPLGGPTEDTFPASIVTPVAVSAAAPPRWRVATADRTAIAGSLLRAASVRIAGAATGGVSRARERWQSRPPPEPRSALASSLTAALDAVSRYAAARKNRLRISGVAVLIALVAYIGGAVLARALNSGPDAAHGGAATTVNKQLTMADKVIRPQQTAALPKPPAASNAPPSDPAARAEFYMARAKAGDAAAQYDVGVLYARGDGLVQDMASAATWFHAAAAQGNVAAEYNLGVMYERGLGVGADQAEALNWYRSAADQNHPGAQFNLALAYANGGGTKQDFATAARWYKRAAEQGLPPAMANLAMLFEGGKGVERSLVEAYAWYSAAGERGDAGAKTRAGELFQRFNEKDKAQAQGLAATIAAALDQAQARPPA
jgi:TPR repeat protein